MSVKLSAALLFVLSAANYCHSAKDFDKTVKYWSRDCVDKNAAQCFKMCAPDEGLCSPCECRPLPPVVVPVELAKDDNNDVKYWSEDCVDPSRAMCRKRCPKNYKMCSPCDCKPVEGVRPRP